MFAKCILWEPQTGSICGGSSPGIQDRIRCSDYPDGGKRDDAARALSSHPGRPDQRRPWVARIEFLDSGTSQHQDNLEVFGCLRASSADFRLCCFDLTSKLLQYSPSLRCTVRINNYAKRFWRMEAKQTLLHNVSMYAESLFQSWKYNDDGSTSDNPSWYQKQYRSKPAKENHFRSQEFHWDTYRNKRKRRFEFCYSDDDDFETIFKSSFKGQRGFYWSFSREENFNWGYSSEHEGQCSSSSSRYNSDYVEDDTSTVTDLAAERLILGLRASGPLRLEEVKKAYRACALRWHPDRHQGSSKVEAEEKFKNCSAAYESLCEQLTLS